MKRAGKDHKDRVRVYTDRTRSIALLGYAMEASLCHAAPPPIVAFPNPWDLWWVCARAEATAGELGLEPTIQGRTCALCWRQATRFVSAKPITHPDLRGSSGCACPREWAAIVRRPKPEPEWPPWSITVAVCKPHAPHRQIARALRNTHTILDCKSHTLTAADTRRLYPDAYGAEFIAVRDRYLTSGPSTVLLLRKHPRATSDPKVLKASIRAQLDGDELRNHLHMPDNPAEALCDIVQFAGPDLLRQLYAKYEYDRAVARLAFYRAALGAGEADADRRSLR